MSSCADSLNWWPLPASAEALSTEARSKEVPADLIVASVNYNTKPMIALLLWSLYRFLGDELRSVIIVDNGSTDGSVELLQAVAEAGLCELLANPKNCHHGPGLSLALSHLAKVQQTSSSTRPWVWLLDSDCVVTHGEVASTAMEAASKANAALVGEAYWNRWNDGYQFSGFSILLDPAQVWRAEVGPIPNGGDPIGEFEKSCRGNGISALSFPFSQDGYLIHRGRSTLAAVRERDESWNPLYEWARDHYDPHFQEVPLADVRYAEIVHEFNREVPALQAEALIRACKRT